MVKLIIFDWKRTLYDPDKKVLMRDAKKLLESIKTKCISMILVGKGGADMQKEVVRLGVWSYFKEVVFAEGEKNMEVFSSLVPQEPGESLFIGDRVRSELEVGKKLGSKTVWVRQGKFAGESPENKYQEPDYAVSSLKDCIKLLKNIL